MRTFSAFALGALFSLTLAPQLGASPQFGGGRERTQNRDRVCVYKDIEYRGAEQCYYPGDEIITLQSQKSTISSIRVYGRARLTVYDETNFRGHSDEFASDVPDLGKRSSGGGHTWNDRIQSLRVDSGYGTSGNAPIWDAAPADSPTVCFSAARRKCTRSTPDTACWSGSCGRIRASS